MVNAFTLILVTQDTELTIRLKLDLYQIILIIFFFKIYSIFSHIPKYKKSYRIPKLLNYVDL